MLGPLTAGEIGHLVKQNTVIRYIDLEYNNLTEGGSNIEGIKHIAEVCFIKWVIIQATY